MPREVVEGIQWIQEAYRSQTLKEELSAQEPGWYVPGEDAQVCNNAYLLSDEQSLLFDTLSPYSTDQILTELERALGGGSLDYLLPSHPENPHAGNTFPILEAYPDVELLAPGYDGSKHDLYHLGNATNVYPGETLDLGTLTVEFLEPTFLDHRIHIWMRELRTNTLFTVDWLGDIHMSRDHLSFVDELEDDDPVARQFVFHSLAMFWFEYADPGKVERAIETVIDEYDPAYVAPAHGLVVRERVPEYMRLNMEVLGRIQGSGRRMGGLV
jgi:flavorubredoxin